MSDNDVFAFTTGAGNVSFNISVAQFGPNLDVVGELWNGNSLILASNPTDKITASLSTFLEAGTYYLHVKSNGEYGRLGQYNLTGTVNPLDSQNVTYSIAADAASVLEGNAGTTTPLSFTITRSSEGQGLQSSGTVDFSLAGGSATLGTDYSLASVSGNGISVSGNQITFAPGATTAKVNLNVIGDFLSESDESVIVALSNPTVAGGTAFIGNTQASSTIVDEDTQIAINDVSTTEGNARNNTIAYKSVSFTVSLSEATIDTVTVNYATADGTAKAGEDYLAASGTLTFNPGETSKTISVSVRKETVFEADETFYLNLSNPTSATIADSQGTGTILNDDTQTTTKKKIAATSNTIDGTGDGELLQGTQNNDKLVGRNGNDTLIGFDASAGVVEADKLIGGKGADLFVLGDANQAYYATEGSDDYAIINDFQLNQQDVIQLHGTAEDYAIGSSPFALEGVGIYLNDAGQNELIGLVNGVTNLDLNSNAFEFV
jgi:serralysin